MGEHGGTTLTPRIQRRRGDESHDHCRDHPDRNVGSRVVRLLVQAGIRPVVLLRDAARLDAVLRERCEIREVGQGDTEAVVRATAGVETLYWVNPPTDDDDPVAGSIRMGESAATAVTENAISRVVFQSSGGAEARSGFGEVDGLGRTEELLDAAGTHVTHLRCGYFFTNLLLDIESVWEGALTTTLPVDHRMPWVDPRDIGDVAAARLLSTAWTGRHTLGMHGPADLSFAETAAILSTALDRTVVARETPEEEAAEAMRAAGFTAAQIDAALGMLRGQRGFTPEDPRQLITATPTPLSAWAHAVLRPALED